MIRQTKEGWWIIDGDSHLGKWIEESGLLAHDISLLPLILPLIPEGGTVVDAGAYCGDHTIAYLNHVGPTGRVLAFEPQPEAFDCLVRNCPTASCHNCALSDHYHSGRLVPDSCTNFGACRVEPLPATEMIKFYGAIIEMISLDSLCLPHVDFLKADVEGGELALLKGALKTIQRSKPILLVEINNHALRKNGTTPIELIAFIMELGYGVANVYTNGAVDGPQWDALCRPIQLSTSAT